MTRDQTDELLSAVRGAHRVGGRDELWRLTRGNVLFLRRLVRQELRAGHMVRNDGVLGWQGTWSVGSLSELVDAQIGAIPDDVASRRLVAVSEAVDWRCLDCSPTDTIEEATAQTDPAVRRQDLHRPSHVRRGASNRCGSRVATPSRPRRDRDEGRRARHEGDEAGTALGKSGLPPTGTYCVLPRRRVRSWTSRPRSGFSAPPPTPASGATGIHSPAPCS